MGYSFSKVQQFPKIIMVLNNNNFEVLPYLLHLCELYCKTAVKQTYPFLKTVGLVVPI